MTKNNYYLTFCHRHQHRHGYARIKASSYESAYLLVVAKFHMDWQQIKPEDEFDKAKYSKGEVMLLEAG